MKTCLRLGQVLTEFEVVSVVSFPDPGSRPQHAVLLDRLMVSGC